MNVKIAFNGHNNSVRDIVIEFGNGGFTIVTVPETEVNTVAKFSSWARRHDVFGKEVLDELWRFLNSAYGWT